MKLLVSDYDGTYSAKEEDIIINNHYIEEFIRRGNLFVLSTGRPYDSILGKTKEYNIPYTHIGASDGNYLFDKEGNLIKEYTIDNKIISELDEISSLDIYEGIQFAYPDSNTYQLRSNEKIGSIAFVIQEGKITNEFLKLYESLREAHKEYRFDVYGYGNIFYYMIRPLGVHKGNMIEALRNKLFIPKKKIYTIGDNINDFEMIRDYNGFMIGENKDLENVALKKYDAVHELIDDIMKKRVLKR